jgi:hypothetical protein
LAGRRPKSHSPGTTARSTGRRTSCCGRALDCYNHVYSFETIVSLSLR